MPTTANPHLRLLQLLSPSIPTGAFHFSQGMEWLVSEGMVFDEKSYATWLREMIEGVLTHQDLPLLRRMFDAGEQGNIADLDYWSCIAVACRDTDELRMEERQRAIALARILSTLDLNGFDDVHPTLRKCSLASIGWAATQWGIEKSLLLESYAYSWLESQVVVGIKLIPLGQLSGQRLLHTLCDDIPLAIQQSSLVENSSIGFSSPMASIASSNHETLHTRLYRS